MATPSIHCTASLTRRLRTALPGAHSRVACVAGVAEDAPGDAVSPLASSVVQSRSGGVAQAVTSTLRRGCGSGRAAARGVPRRRHPRPRIACRDRRARSSRTVAAAPGLRPCLAREGAPPRRTHAASPSSAQVEVGTGRREQPARHPRRRMRRRLHPCLSCLCGSAGASSTCSAALPARGAAAAMTAVPVHVPMLYRSNRA